VRNKGALATACRRSRGIGRAAAFAGSAGCYEGAQRPSRRRLYGKNQVPQGHTASTRSGDTIKERSRSPNCLELVVQTLVLERIWVERSPRAVGGKPACGGQSRPAVQ
jgi:hypothetical protein